MCLKHLETIAYYGLFPNHYLSALVLSWNTMFNMTKFESLNLFQTLTQIDPKNDFSNKYSSNIYVGCVLGADFEFLKELHELQNDYPLYPDKISITKETLSSYRLEIDDFYRILISNILKKCINFLIRKTMCSIVRTCNFH